MTLFDTDDAPLDAGADIAGDYRYSLWRRLVPAGDRTLLWVMLNPSTADAHQDDPTIRRVAGFTRREGFARFEVVNLYALRSTDPWELVRHPSPIGERNDEAITDAAAAADAVMCAWGGWNPSAKSLARRHADRIAAVEHLLAEVDRPTWALGRTKAHRPRHPRYVAADQDLIPWL